MRRSSARHVIRLDGVRVIGMADEYRFGPSVDEIGRARGFVRSFLRDMNCRAPEDVVALLTSELVTNAVRHAGAVDARLEVDCPDGSTARVAVWDGGGGDLPTGDDIRPHENGGFGLVLVSEMADRWGVDRVDSLKRVWFEVSAD